ncbi:PREDICTED: photosynthetic NDH subunit of lumenal location 1, chloroplastic [Tarenaya hassleriana]|uniref:photosynthetic NDH subunit of lumenal location 1, chloroplastic n=1 Tax=Tarenaya hassleriana TaxID=28532 RepID=UPI00053C81AF|nr:PREDICTED: photosynthetic NDH subunit of lumenal location 1, chloroplastic [Tarenaya hassleriana]
MSVSSLSLGYVSTTKSNKTDIACPSSSSRACLLSPCCKVESSGKPIPSENRTSMNCKRRLALLGAGTLVATTVPASFLLAEEVVPKNFTPFVDRQDGYSYYYPSDWREFDFRAHDSAFKDRYMQLQNVRVRFIPTDKKDVRDLGPMEEVVYDLVKHIYAAPNQVATIYDMKERVIDGKSYYTFEYGLASKNYATTSFATIAIGNNRYYTLIVGANERRWRRMKNMLKVVAESFKVLDI